MATKEQINELNKLAERYGLKYEEGGSFSYDFMVSMMIEMMKELEVLRHPPVIIDNGSALNVEDMDLKPGAYTYVPHNELPKFKFKPLTDPHVVSKLNYVADEHYGLYYSPEEHNYEEFIATVLEKVIEDLAELRSLTGNT